MEFFDIPEMSGRDADAVMESLRAAGIRFGREVTQDPDGRRVKLRVKGTADDLARARALLPDLPEAEDGRLPRGLDRVTAALVVRALAGQATPKARAWATRVLDRALARVEEAIADPPPPPAGDTKGA